MLNQQIGPYKIISKLGEGGMALVYLAEKGTLRKQVALKVLNEDFISNRNIRGRFLSEAKKMINLNHPNIVGVQDLIDEPDFVAIELEYIEGVTLKQYLNEKGALPDDEIEVLFKQMLDALGYVHDKGYVHRDIKPSNFMLMQNGTIKLTDFGIAKNSGDSNIDYTGTGTGMQMGTPKYMSPEQVRSTKDVDHRSDIYSLGVVLWEMVTGNVPYDIATESMFDVFRKIVDEPLEKTNSKWDGVIEKCTNKNIEDRYSKLNNLVAEFNENPKQYVPDLNENEDDKKRNFKDNIKIFNIAAIIVISATLLPKLFTSNSKSYDKSTSQEQTVPDWKVDFEQRWNNIQKNEPDSDVKTSLDEYTVLLNSLPLEASGEREMVQKKIVSLKVILDANEKLAEQERLKSEKERIEIEQDKLNSEVDNGTRQIENENFGSFKDYRDGKTYKTIKIGNQVWMAENLAFKPSFGNYWAYHNRLTNVTEYGYFYDWETACKVCPDGWHLPSDYEWTQLTNYLGGINAAGNKIKSTSGWMGNGNGSNTSYFTGLPGGFRLRDGTFNNIGYSGVWWSSTSNTEMYSLYRYLDRYDFFRKDGHPDSGFSVRCVKD